MKKWAEWLLVAGALCMGMAGCGSEEKNTSNADAEQKSETASETREEGQAPEQTDTEGSEEAELLSADSNRRIRRTGCCNACRFSGRDIRRR